MSAKKLLTILYLLTAQSVCYSQTFQILSNNKIVVRGDTCAILHPKEVLYTINKFTDLKECAEERTVLKSQISDLETITEVQKKMFETARQQLEISRFNEGKLKEVVSMQDAEITQLNQSLNVCFRRNRWMKIQRGIMYPLLIGGATFLYFHH